MPNADWYFDFVSPFSYLQCEQLPTLERSIRVRYRPVLFAGLLKAYAHKGPAEIPAKRRFTYRHVVWQARVPDPRQRSPSPQRSKHGPAASKCDSLQRGPAGQKMP